MRSAVVDPSTLPNVVVENPVTEPAWCAPESGVPNRVRLNPTGATGSEEDVVPNSVALNPAAAHRRAATASPNDVVGEALVALPTVCATVAPNAVVAVPLAVPANEADATATPSAVLGTSLDACPVGAGIGARTLSASPNAVAGARLVAASTLSRSSTGVPACEVGPRLLAWLTRAAVGKPKLVTRKSVARPTIVAGVPTWAVGPRLDAVQVDSVA